MRRVLGRWIVFGLPLIGAGGAIAVGLWKVGWPSAEFWNLHDHLIIWFIVAAALVPFVQTSISELGEKSRRKKLEREALIRSMLIPALVNVVRHCNAPWDLTGIQAFLLKGFWRRRHHERVAKVRLASSIESGVLWTRDKGVIGRCWARRASIIVDLSQPPFSDLGNVPKDQWETVPVNDRYGLSYSDYAAIGTKYGIVIAVPIMQDSGGYIGCVTLDLPPGRSLARQDEAVEFLATTAGLVCGLVRR
jgi:hypothetical protein